MTHTTDVLDALDRRILDQLQQAVPLTPRPFDALAQQVGIDPHDCLARVRALRGPKKVIRQMSAIFDTSALGYESSLVAAKIAPDHLEEAAQIISGHPGVSHNYQREHAFNLWYTVAVPPGSRFGLQGTLDKLHEISGAISTRALPTLRLFKIGVRLDMGDDARDQSAENAPKKSGFNEEDRAIARQYTLSDADRRMVKVLQQDLPIEPEPFAWWAEEAGCTVDELLAAAERYIEHRQMRRFAAVLHHRTAGMRANVMGVWSVAPEVAEEYGPRLAQFDAVSHCYLRPRYDDWPYNLYTMIHARDRDQALITLEKMQEATGIEDYRGLWTVREFKKVRLRYFTDEIPQWESQHA